MSTPRLLARIPSAELIAVAKLPRHCLRFHKVSRDGSAKCDARPSDTEDEVFGVVFDIGEKHIPHLDRIEGVGWGYDQKAVTLITPDETHLEAFTYCATIIDTALKPYHWYKEHVVRGAREHCLPAGYIEFIERVESVPDPNVTPANCRCILNHNDRHRATWACRRHSLTVHRLLKRAHEKQWKNHHLARRKGLWICHATGFPKACFHSHQGVFQAWSAAPQIARHYQFFDFER